MTFSRHAKDQMTMRGIGKPNVFAVLIHGNRFETRDPNIVRYVLEDLHVLVDEFNDTVVTTFHHRSPNCVSRHRRKKKYRNF